MSLSDKKSIVFGNLFDMQLSQGNCKRALSKWNNFSFSLLCSSSVLILEDTKRPEEFTLLDYFKKPLAYV